MLSPNIDQLAQERMQDIDLSATGNSRLGTVGNPLTIPQITAAANVPLHWGEWLRIAVTATLAAAVVIEAIFFMMSAVWFGDLKHALLPFVPLALTLFIAALVMRFPEAIAGLRQAAPVFFVAGIVVTALVLIRLFAIAGLAPDDWSWLASFAHIADPTAEQPHTEIGMMGISLLAWIMGVRLARHGGDYEKRRAAFIGFFVLLIVAVILALLTAADSRGALSGMLAVLLPVYMFLGLVTLGQVRLAEVQRRVMSATGSRRQVMLWRLMTVALALVAILFVVLAALIFYGHSYTQALDIAINFLGAVLLIIVTIMFWIIAPLVSLLANSGRTAGQSAAVCTPTPATGETPAPIATPLPTTTPAASCIQQHTLVGGQDLHISPEVVYVIVLLVAVVAAAILAYLFFVRRGERAGAEDEYEETQEHLTMRVPRTARHHEGSAPAFTAPTPGTVRAAYRDFLRNSAAAGLARHDDETATEFEQRIAPVVSADPPATSPAAVEHLTAAYQDERYGAVGATAERFAQAQALTLALAGRLASWRKTTARRRNQT